MNCMYATMQALLVMPGTESCVNIVAVDNIKQCCIIHQSSMTFQGPKGEPGIQGSPGVAAPVVEPVEGGKVGLDLNCHDEQI